MKITERHITYGEFLTYQEKYPKTKAVFTAATFLNAKGEFKLTAETKGKMSILLDEDKVWN